MLVRNFEKTDTADCLAIYSYYVDNTVIAFEEKVPTLEEFEERLNKISSNYPFLVAIENNRVMGYAYLDTFNERTAYRYTTDFSIYLDKDCCHKGVGSLLYGELERQAKQEGIKNIIAIITTQNDDSLHFHMKMGFHCVGELKNVGYKFKRWLSVKYYQKPLA